MHAMTKPQRRALWCGAITIALALIALRLGAHDCGFLAGYFWESLTR